MNPAQQEPSDVLVALNRDAVIASASGESTVDLDKHRSASDLDELDLDDTHEASGNALLRAAILPSRAGPLGSVRGETATRCALGPSRSVQHVR
jgi:hypothetical protein